MIMAQIYVYGIVFGSTSAKLVQEFVHLMQTEFEMSMVGELNIFLDLQVKQHDDGLFICQNKYTRNMAKRFVLDNARHVKTPMSSSEKLSEDEGGKQVDSSLYRSIIGLLHLTTSRPDIYFSVRVCARYQSNPKESHLTDVKKILCYVNGTADYGLWYSKNQDSSLCGYNDGY